MNRDDGGVHHMPPGTEPGSPAPTQDELRDRFFKALLASLRSVALYSVDHPACVAAIQELSAASSQILSASDPLILGVVEGDLVINGQPLVQQAIVHERLIDLLEKKKIEKIVIKKDVGHDDLKHLVMILSTEPVEGWEALNRLLEERGIGSISAGRIQTERVSRRDEGADTGLEAAESDYQKGLDLIRELNYAAGKRGEIRPKEVSSLARILVKGVMENQGSLMTILNLHSKDEYTATHCLDVAILTLLQVDRFRLPESRLNDIATAALLHDLGKLRVPVEVLNKPGRLTDEEWVLMRKHPAWGAEMIHGIRGISEPAVIVAFEHHVRHDEQGYPLRRRQRPLNILSEMVTISDTYDAVRSKRPYQEEMLPEKAAAILQKGSGTIFEPLLVRRFLEQVGIFGLGTMVKLATGELAVVIRNNRSDPSRPVVRIVADPDGRQIDGIIVNTAMPESGGLTVACSLIPDEATIKLLLSRGMP